MNIVSTTFFHTFCICISFVRFIVATFVLYCYHHLCLLTCDRDSPSICYRTVAVILPSVYLDTAPLLPFLHYICYISVTYLCYCRYLSSHFQSNNILCEVQHEGGVLIVNAGTPLKNI